MEVNLPVVLGNHDRPTDRPNKPTDRSFTFNNYKNIAIFNSAAQRFTAKKLKNINIISRKFHETSSYTYLKAESMACLYIIWLTSKSNTYWLATTWRSRSLAFGLNTIP